MNEKSSIKSIIVKVVITIIAGLIVAYFTFILQHSIVDLKCTLSERIVGNSIL